MRFMCIVKHKEGPLDVPPALYEAMNQLGEDAAKAGCVKVAQGGLLPTAEGARITLNGGKIAVTDGPFAEAKEVIGGFAIFEAASKA
ncbi:MAG TPA: YciI family protein, partial [Methyloceanibacter sp.]|nr:YciI family protein [Methyloceanibacter sp.]